MFTAVRSLIVLCTLVSFALTSAIAGNVTGKVNFSGKAPSRTLIKMNADQKCMKMQGGKQVESDQVVVNSNSTLKNVFVYVKSGLNGKKYPSPTEKVSIDQKGCMYTPHVLGAMVNQPIEITNSDPTLHNIHALTKKSKQFNIAQPKQGMKMTQKFDQPEVMVKIKCEVHNWMASYVGVLDHPFYGVSDGQGSFTIKNLPPGEYELEAWHEKYGTQTMKVKVAAADAKADFTFAGK